MFSLANLHLYQNQLQNVLVLPALIFLLPLFCDCLYIVKLPLGYHYTFARNVHNDTKQLAEAPSTICPPAHTDTVSLIGNDNTTRFAELHSELFDRI